MFLKRRVRQKDGKEHVYYSLCESLRVTRRRTLQRQVLHLGELNTGQLDAWERTLAVIHEEEGRRAQAQLFTAEEGGASAARAAGAGRQIDVLELRLSSLRLRAPRRFGDCWAGCRLWQELGLDEFWQERLGGQRGEVPWARVLELLVVNRLLDPRSELFVHEKWFGQTAMDVLLEGDATLASKDRLYRCLDRILAHRPALESHLAARWRDLFGAKFELVLYDLTSTYFEGSAEAVPEARRGYSRDHRPDCVQLVLALIVTAEGFPLTYEVFPGNRLDVTTLPQIVEQVESRHGQAQRVWVFDRGIVSEANLAWLRERGAYYLVGTPRQKLRHYESELLEQGWQQVAAQVQVKLCAAAADGAKAADPLSAADTYVLCRSRGRVDKEQAMRRRALKAALRDLHKLRGLVARGRLKDPKIIDQRVGALRERHRPVLRFLRQLDVVEGRLCWAWDKAAWRAAGARAGAYLLRAHWPGQNDPAQLWQTYVQLTEAEAAFRTLKSELRLRPIWHHKSQRVQAHIFVAFLSYALWVCLKKLAAHKAPSLTPWQVLDSLRQIVLVDVEFETTDGRTVTLPRITLPENAQAALLWQLGWKLPEQPPPRIRAQAARDIAQIT